MNSPLSGRNQKLILLKLKQGLHFVSLVAFSIWLVYRIHHLHAEKQDSYRNLYNPNLGRKVNLGWFTQRRSSDVESVVFFDIIGNQLTTSQEERLNEYFMERGASIVDKALRGDSTKQRNPLLVQEKSQLILESTVDITRESHHNEVEEDRSKANDSKIRTTSSVRENDVAVVPVGVTDKNDVLTDPVYIHPKHHLTEEHHHGHVFNDENGVPPGLIDANESRNYELER